MASTLWASTSMPAPVLSTANVTGKPLSAAAQGHSQGQAHVAQADHRDGGAVGMVSINSAL